MNMLGCIEKVVSIAVSLTIVTTRTALTTATTTL
jgi:hypothetical protein